MFKRVVVGFDESEGSRDALALGHQLAGRLGAELVVVRVVPTPTGGHLVPALPADAYTNLVNQAKAGLDLVAEELGADVEIVESTSPARGLAEFTESLEEDLLVLGCSGAEPGKVQTGHKARSLMQGSPCTVALAPAGYRRNRGALSSIGVAVVGAGADRTPTDPSKATGSEVDVSPESNRALETAIDFANSDSSIRVISVANDFAESWGFWGATLTLSELSEASRTLARKVIDKALDSIPEEVPTEAVLLEGSAADQLRLQSATGLDLLCIGSRSFGPLRRVLLGSVSSQLVQEAACPVMVLPRS